MHALITAITESNVLPALATGGVGGVTLAGSIALWQHKRTLVKVDSMAEQLATLRALPKLVESLQSRTGTLEINAEGTRVEMRQLRSDVAEVKEQNTRSLELQAESLRILREIVK